MIAENRLTPLLYRLRTNPKNIRASEASSSVIVAEAEELRSNFPDDTPVNIQVFAEI